MIINLLIQMIMRYQRKKGSQHIRKAPITTPRVTNALCSFKTSSEPPTFCRLKIEYLSPRRIHASPLFYHWGGRVKSLRWWMSDGKPSSILTPDVTKTELLARILASTMIVPRLMRSRTPRVQLWDSLRLRCSESSGVRVPRVCRSCEHFTSSFWSSSSSCRGSFLCKLWNSFSLIFIWVHQFSLRPQPVSPKGCNSSV